MTPNSAGNLTAKKDNRKGNYYFTYDPAGHIIQSIDPENRIKKFLHDPAGDLLVRQETRKEGHGEDYLRCLGFEGTRYYFNAAGNLVERRGTRDHITFEWDAKDQLTAARNHTQDTLTEIAYDAVGRRLAKTTGDRTTLFTWDGNQLLADNTACDGFREFVYYPGTFEPLAVIDTDRSVYYFHNDLVGLPQEVTDTRGNIVWSVRYDALGQIEKQYADDFHNPLRFQGQYYDPEIDLCYNRFRYFDAATGSFNSSDPLGLAAGVNVYRYAPNVWGWVDPLGLSCGNVSTGAGRNHVTYAGVKNGKPYSGYASAPAGEFETPEELIDYRYGGNFDEYGGIPPKPVDGTFGTGVEGKAKARGTEQLIYQQNVDKFGKSGVANKQNPVGPNNKRLDGV